MRIRALLALLMSGLLAFVAACGDDDDDEPTATQAGDSDVATATSDAEESPTGEATGESTEDANASPTTDDEATPTEDASPTDEAADEKVAPTDAGDTGTATPDDATAEAGAEIPDSPVGERLTWVLDHLNQGATELTPEVIEENFTFEFLDSFPAEQFSASLQKFAAANAPLTFQEFLRSPTSSMALALLLDSAGDEILVTLELEDEEPHRVSALLLQPVPRAADLQSWDDFDTQFSALAQDASFVAGEVMDGGFEPIHALESESRLAIGSSFKLYVLGELARQIEAGEASWDDELAIRDEWKSLPTGIMQEDPAGETSTLREYAELMISISDNTAADHLVHHLGRENVEAMQAEMGHGEPGLNVPFLTTRDLFALKMALPEDRVDAYLAASPEERREMLETEVAEAQLSPEDGSDWTEPRWIDEIEWFASTEDLARAIVWLDGASQREGLEPIREILSMNPGAPLEQGAWAYIGFKGGSELGVLSFNWLLESAGGRTFVVSGTLNDQSQLIDQTAALELMMGALDLLAAEGQ